MGRRYLLFVHSRAVEGRDAEYDDWYSHTHLADMVALPGFEAAQRWVHVDDGTGGAPPPYDDIAIYEVDEEHYEQARAALDAARREREEALAEGRAPRLPVSAAMSEDRVSWWFVENSPRVVRDAEGG